MENQVISIRTFHEIYDIQEASEPSSECSKTRNKLKKKIVSLYGEKHMFLTARINTPEIVISAATIDTQVVVSDKESSIIKVANYLHKDIEEYCDLLPATHWPRTVEELSADNRLPPASITLFRTSLLKSVGHGVSVNVQRLVESYTDDLILNPWSK